MSLSAPEDAFLDVNDAHLRVFGNVHADGLKLGQLEVVTTTSTGSTIQFLHQHTAFTTTSNIEVGTTNHDLFVDTENSRVGILTNTPTKALDVNGTVKATAFDGDGALLTGIPSSAINGTLSQWTTVTGPKIHYSDGNVGIGIADPLHTLDVVGDINFTGTLREDGNPFVSTPWTIESGPTALSYTLGNVGVGGTTPSAKLEVTGNAHVSTDLSVGGNLTINTISAAATHGLGAVTALSNTSADTVLLTNTGTSLVASGAVQAVSAIFSGDVTVDTNTFHVDTTNSRVGLGTTSPGEKLHVNGNIRLGASADNTTDDNTDRTISTAGQLTIKANDSDIDGAYTNLTLQAGKTNPGKIIIGGDDGATGSNGSRIDFYTAGATTPVCKIDHDGYLLPKAFAFFADGSGGNFKTQKSLMHDPVMTITQHFDYHPNPNGIYRGFREQSNDGNRGIYFAPVKGVYQFTCKARLHDNNTGQYEIEWYIKRNGSHSPAYAEEKYTSFEMWASPADGGGRRSHMSSSIVKLDVDEGFFPRNDGSQLTCSRVTFGGHFLGTY